MTEQERRRVLAVDDGEGADLLIPARFMAGIRASPTNAVNARCFVPGTGGSGAAR